MKYERDPFVLIQDPSTLLPVALARLPKAVNMYNMLLLATKIPGYHDQVQFFAVNGDTDPNTSWLVAVDHREDYGFEINLCFPQGSESSEDNEASQASMLNAFTRTRAIDWRKPFMICAMHGRETEFMLWLQLKILANPVQIVASNLYTVDPEVGRSLRLQPPSGVGVEFKSIDTEADAEFVTTNWHRRRPGSIDYVRRAVAHLPSTGLHCDGELVACAITTLTGFIGYVYTSKAHRGRGFGRLVEMHLIKQMADVRAIPYLTVKTVHTESVRFHETKIEGLKLSHKVEFIFHTPEKFDD